MTGNPGPVGSLNPPIFSVAGDYRYTIEQANDPYEILVESDPVWYPVTYKSQYGRMPAEPQHIDDGTRVDSGSIIVPRTVEFVGVPLCIVARSFDPSGALGPSLSTYGWYSYTGGAVIVFNPPTGHVFTSIDGAVIFMSAQGYMIRYAVATDGFPPAPQSPSLGLGGLDQVGVAYGTAGGEVRYITARAWANNGDGAASPPQYAIYYHQPA